MDFTADNAIQAILSAPDETKDQLIALDVQITVGFDSRMALSESVIAYVERRGGVYFYAQRRCAGREVQEFGDAVNSVERTHEMLDRVIAAFRRTDKPA